MNTVAVVAMIMNMDITMQMKYLQAGEKKLLTNLTEQELKKFLKCSVIQKIMEQSFVQREW